MESEELIITDQPHPVLKEGFPLDSLSIDIRSGKYFHDLSHETLDLMTVEDGFLKFFQRILFQL